MAETLSKLVVQITADDSKFNKSLSRIQNTTKKTGKALSKNLTLPLGVVAGAILKVSADFEKGLNRVKALTGATAQEFEQLKERARELGSQTEFSATQATQAMSFFAQAGFDANKIYDVLPDTLNLASAAQLELGQSADIVSNIMTGFGIEADNLGNVVDILTKQFTSSNTDLTQLGEAFKFVAPVAQGFGVSIEETSAALGVLSDAGLQASVAGTGLRRVLSVLAQNSEKLGIQVFDAAGDIRPLADIIEELEGKGLSTAQALEIFGERGGPAISQLLSTGSEALREYTERLKDVEGTAENIAKTQLEGLNGELKKFKSAAEESAIALGETLLPLATDLIKEFTELTKKFNKLGDGQKEFIVKAGLVAAAVGPIISGVSGITAAIKVLSVALATNPIILIATAAATATFAIGKTIKNANSLEDETKELEKTTKNLKDVSNEYKDVTIKLNKETTNLTQAEIALLKIRKEQLKLEIINNLKKINEQIERNTKKTRESNKEANDFYAERLRASGILKKLTKNYENLNVNLDENKKRQTEILKQLKDENLKQNERIKLQNEYRRLIAEETKIRNELLTIQTRINNQSAISQTAQKKENKLKKEALELQTAQEKAIKEAAQLIADGILSYEELGVVNETLKNKIDAQVKAIKEQKKAQKENIETTKENIEETKEETKETGKNTEETNKNTEAKKRAKRTIKDVAEATEELTKAKKDLTSQELIEGYQQQKLIKNLEKIKEKYKEISPTVEDTFSKISDIVNQTFENTMTKNNNEYENKKENLEKQLEAENLTAREKEKINNKLIALEEKKAKAEAKIKEKQFRAEKTAAIIKGTIDTASAVIEAIPNPFLMGLAGSLGAAQVGLIAAQPIPKFQNGGIVENTGIGQQFIAGDGAREYIVPEDKSYLSELGQNIVNSLDRKAINNNIINDQPIYNQIILDSRIIQDVVSKGTKNRTIKINREALV